MKLLFYRASVTLAFSASSVAAELTAEVPKGDPEFTAKAMSAAPADIGKDATNIRIGNGFKLTPIKAGTNGWTCTVDTDGTPWCADAAGVECSKAISTKAEPPDKTASSTCSPETWAPATMILMRLTSRIGFKLNMFVNRWEDFDDQETYSTRPGGMVNLPPGPSPSRFSRSIHGA